MTLLEELVEQLKSVHKTMYTAANYKPGGVIHIGADDYKIMRLEQMVRATLFAVETDNYDLMGEHTEALFSDCLK